MFKTLESCLKSAYAFSKRQATGKHEGFVSILKFKATDRDKLFFYATNTFTGKGEDSIIGDVITYPKQFTAHETGTFYRPYSKMAGASYYTYKLYATGKIDPKLEMRWKI